MTAIPASFGSGGSGLAPGSQPIDLATTLRDMADDLAAKLPPVPAWDTGVAVSSNAATLASAGYVVAIHVTAGSVTGVISVLSTGTPATKQCTVTYAASGVPTLTFAAGDAVTAISVLQIKQTASYTVKTTKA